MIAQPSNSYRSVENILEVQYMCKSSDPLDDILEVQHQRTHIYLCNSSGPAGDYFRGRAECFAFCAFSHQTCVDSMAMMINSCIREIQCLKYGFQDL